MACEFITMGKISIHALREESDLPGKHRAVIDTDFYPRSP